MSLTPAELKRIRASLRFGFGANVEETKRLLDALDEAQQENERLTADLKRLGLRHTGGLHAQTLGELREIANARLKHESTRQVGAMIHRLCDAYENAWQHLGADPTNERIREAHSAMYAEWLAGNEEVHRVYKQGHDERCYICALLAREDLARRQAETLAEAAEKVWKAAPFRDQRVIALNELRKALDGYRGQTG